jgi:hypothetical protein
MKQAQMLYKQGSRLKWQGLDLDFIVVDAAIDGEIEKYLADGWSVDPEKTDTPAEPEPDEVKPRRGRPPKVHNVD